MMRMAYRLKVIYDERDFLEAWIPESDGDLSSERESGIYETLNCARIVGSGRALDFIMEDGFSKSYHRIIAEVREKEPQVPDRYDVPEFGLYDVPLGDVLDYVYHNLVPEWRKRPSVVYEVPLPAELARLTALKEGTPMWVTIIDEDTIQLRRAKQ